MSNTIDWPSTPDAAGKVPALMELLSASDDRARFVQVLTTQAAALARRLNAKMDGFQIPITTPAGSTTIPGILTLPDKSVRLLYAHHGEWDPDATLRLLHWILKLRLNAQTLTLDIEVLWDGPEVPRFVREIAENSPRARVGICAALYGNPGDPALAAQNAEQMLSFLAGTKIAADRAGLRELETLIQKHFGVINEDWYYRPACVAFLGALLGQAVIAAYGGAWAEAIPPNPAWMKQVKIGEHRLNPMGRASKFLRNPRTDPLTEFFDMSTPNVLAQTEATVKKAMEGQGNA